MPTVGMQKRNRCTKFAGVSVDKKCQRDWTHRVSARRQWDGLAYHDCRCYVNQSALHGRCSQLGCGFWGLRACVSQELCHSRDFAVTAGTLARIGPSISERQDAQGLGNARCYNALDLLGKVFTVKIPFVVCEVKRPLLSLAMLEDMGFHVTVQDGCRKLGGHGHEMNLRRQGNSYLVDVEFRGGLLEKRTEIGFLLGLVAPVDSVVVGLSTTAGVDERRAVTISTPEAPSREAVESHLLTHIPFAPWCRACISGKGRESPHFRQSREELVATPVISLDCFFLGLTDSTGDGIIPTLALCDGNTTYSLGLMVPKKRSCAICCQRCLRFSARVGLNSHGSQM